MTSSRSPLVLAAPALAVAILALVGARGRCQLAAAKLAQEKPGQTLQAIRLDTTGVLPPISNSVQEIMATPMACPPDRRSFPESPGGCQERLALPPSVRYAPREGRRPAAVPVRCVGFRQYSCR